MDITYTLLGTIAVLEARIEMLRDLLSSTPHSQEAPVLAGRVSSFAPYWEAKRSELLREQEDIHTRPTRIGEAA